MYLSKYDGQEKDITSNCEGCPFYLEMGYQTPRGKKRDIVCNWGRHLTILVQKDDPKKCGLKPEESPNVVVVKGRRELHRTRDDVIDKLVKLEELSEKRHRRKQGSLARRNQLQFYFSDERREFF